MSKKKEIIDLYNRYVESRNSAMERMDDENEKISRKADEQFVAAMFAMSAIDRVLDIIGATLVVDEGNGGIAVDIENFEAEGQHHGEPISP